MSWTGRQPTCGACRASIGDDDRFCRRCGAVVSGADQAEPAARKSVTILFIDLVDSTTLAERLDPEVLGKVLGQYYQACASCIASHGGMIEKYIGDAVMAVFGVPISHEEDALRAVRAAHAAMRAVGELAVPGGKLTAHAGVTWGEVAVMLTPGTHLRIIGDPVNLAARLQGAAAPGEILVNAEVAHLVRPFVVLDKMPPLTLKGKTEPVPAWRVRSLGAVPLFADRVPLVGRTSELAELAHCYGRVQGERILQRALVTGPAGIGKSRLVREFLARMSRPGPTVLSGQCQPYGKDITFQPVASMLRDSLATSSADAWSHLLGRNEDGERAARSLAALLGEVPLSAVTRVGIEEISWAAARLFSALARHRPLVLVWEELHWAEPSLLSLIDDLARRLAGQPVMLVCLGRNGISRWLSGRWDCEIALGPLAADETLGLVGALLGERDEVQAQGLPAEAVRIARACEGNPLFATVMADMVADDVATGGLPPTVSAVLRARIDALPEAERIVLQMAATCGLDFKHAQLAALAAAHPAVSGDLQGVLASLVRRDLLRQASTGRYWFTQTLIHDTGYATVAKSQRARWHAALAQAPDEVAGESMIYHAETACLLHREVNPHEPGLPELAAKAVRLLTDEGTIALSRRDLNAAVALFTRALNLVPDGAAERVVIVLRLADAFVAAGDSDGALDILARSEDVAAGAAERRALAIQRSIVRHRLGLLGFGEAWRQIAAYREELSGAPAEHVNWCLLHEFGGLLEFGQGRGRAAETELRAALGRADAAGDEYKQDRLLGALCEMAQWSPITVSDGLQLSHELAARFEADRLLLIPVLTTRARLLGLRADFGAAYQALAIARGYATDMNAAVPGIAVTQATAYVHALAGDHDTAAALYGLAAAELHAHGHRLPARTLEIYEVREMLCAGNRRAAATGFARLSPESQEHVLDVRARTWLTLVAARLACADGRAQDGAALAEQGLRSIGADDPCLLGDAWFEYAKVLRAAGRRSEAVSAAARAEAHYTAKEATCLMDAVRRWITGLPE